MLTYPYKISQWVRKFHREKKRKRVVSLDIIIKYFILVFNAHPTCVWYIVVHLVGFGGQQEAYAFTDDTKLTLGKPSIT